MVLVIAIFLLGGVPACILLIGRLVVRATDKPAHAAIEARKAALANRPLTRPEGEAPWYLQPMRPAFKKPDAEA